MYLSLNYGSMTGSVSILFLFLLLIPHTLLPAQQADEIDWKYEINLLVNELSQRHKDLYFKTDSVAFHSAFNKIASEAGDYSLFRVSLLLQQVLARRQMQRPVLITILILMQMQFCPWNYTGSRTGFMY